VEHNLADFFAIGFQRHSSAHLCEILRVLCGFHAQHKTNRRGTRRYSQRDAENGQAGNRNLIVTYPDEILYEAIDKMMRNDIGRLPTWLQGLA
jgi:hypothetical protein